MQLVEYVNSLFEQGLSGEEVIAKTQEWKKKNQSEEEEVKIEGVVEQTDATAPPTETPEASENLESGSGTSQLDPTAEFNLDIINQRAERKTLQDARKNLQEFEEKKFDFNKIHENVFGKSIEESEKDKKKYKQDQINSILKKYEPNTPERAVAYYQLDLAPDSTVDTKTYEAVVGYNENLKNLEKFKKGETKDAYNIQGLLPEVDASDIQRALSGVNRGEEIPKTEESKKIKLTLENLDNISKFMEELDKDPELKDFRSISEMLEKSKLEILGDTFLINMPLGLEATWEATKGIIVDGIDELSNKLGQTPDFLIESASEKDPNRVEFVDPQTNERILFSENPNKWKELKDARLSGQSVASFWKGEDESEIGRASDAYVINQFKKYQDLNNAKIKVGEIVKDFDWKNPSKIKFSSGNELFGGIMTAIEGTVSSVIPAMVTGGASLIPQMGAPIYMDYNIAKANSLYPGDPDALAKLVANDQTEFKTPAALTALATSLEYIGFKGVAKHMMGKTGKLKPFVSLMYSQLGEGSTEWGQFGIEELNKNIAVGKTLGESMALAVEGMASKEGVENFLMGVVGAGSMGVPGTIRNTVSRALITETQVFNNATKLIQEISSLQQSRSTVNNKAYKEAVDLQIQEKEESLKDLLDNTTKLTSMMTKEEQNQVIDFLSQKKKNNKTLLDLNKSLAKNEITAQQYASAKGGVVTSNKSITSKIDRVLADANKRLIEGEVAVIEDVAGKENVETFDTVDDFVEATGQDGEVDAFIDESGKIFINKQRAAEVGAITAGSHELLHRILRSTFQSNPDTALKLVESFKNILSEKERAAVDKRIEENYKDATAEVKAEEYLTSFSDAIGKGEITYKDNLKETFMRLAKPILDIFRPRGYNKLNFKDGRDVYNFIKDYQKNIKKGKISERAQKLQELEEVDLGIIKKSVTNREIASNEVQKIYDEQGPAGAMDIIAKFKPITNKIVEARSQAPNFDRQLLTDEIETGKRGILDLVMEYKTESGVPLAAYINKFLPARAIEASKRVLGEEFTTDVTEAKGVVAEEAAEVVTKEKPLAKKPTETVEFSQAQIEKTGAKNKAEVEAKVTKATNEAFKGRDIKTFGQTRNVPKAVADIYAGMFGLNPQTITDKTRNYQKTDAEGLTTAKQFLLKNANNDFARLPKTKDGFGKGTFLPRNVMNALYTDGKLTGTLKDYIGLIRQKPVKPIYRDAVGQTIRGLLNLHIRNRMFEDLVTTTPERLRGGAKFSRTTAYQNLFQALPFERVKDDFSTLNNFRWGAILQATLKGSGVSPIDMKTSEGRQRFKDYAVSSGLISKFPKDFWRSMQGTTENLLKDETKKFGKAVKETREFVESLVKDPDVVIDEGQFRGYTGNLPFINVKEVNEWIAETEANGGVFAEDSQLFSDMLKKENPTAKRLPIEKALNDPAFIKRQENSINGLKKVFEIFQDAMKTPEGIAFVAAIMSSSGASQNHFIRKSAPWKFYQKGYLDQAIREEHTLPASLIGKYLFMSALEGAVSSDFKNVKKNFFQGALLKTNDDRLKGFKPTGGKYNYVESTPEGWKITDNIWARYFNINVANTEGGINPQSIILANNKSVFDLFGVTPSGLKLNEQSVKDLPKVEKALNEVVPKSMYSKTTPSAQQNIYNQGILDGALNKARRPDAPVKKIRVFDFDDTLARSKSMVIVNMPVTDVDLLDIAARRKFKKQLENLPSREQTFDNLTEEQQAQVLKEVPGATRKINATEFAAQAADLEAQGATFDFTEFSKVVEGKKGPLFSVAQKIAEARGTEDIFILTARPQDAAGPIQEFMKANGIDIPLANITGLGDGTAAAKGRWIAGKAAEGYNDFYFADDAIKNVQAVKDVLSQIDVKSKVQQAKFSKTKVFDRVFNDIIEAKTGIESYKQFSAAKAKTVGASKGKFTFFTTPSAEDFLGLLYKTLGKGKVGDAQMAFYKTNLLDPYNRAEIAISQAKVAAGRDYKALKKQFKNIPKTLEKETGIAKYTYQHAIRTYIWNSQGLEVPGLSKRDQKRLTDFVKADPELQAFADQLVNIQKGKPYPKPDKNWTAGTITTDVISGINKVNRAEYLQEWQENVDIIFSEKNMNKLEAAFGAKYVEALKDSLRAMKSGSNRPLGGDRVSDGILDWLNNSVGAIMFLNTRSAVLQTISAVNFVNWGDNNILKAGKAFANQKQFWGDFLTLMNSDYLLERRDGLKINVSESEIADAVEGSKNKVNAAISYLLNKGFVFTRYADSFAIASGGATFYRNRVESLVEQGMDRKAAEEQAFNDFRAIAEENQQSSSPSKISQQQRSLIGRIILQFGNTQLQYVRIQKRAVQDLVNKRGDWKSNISKIVYYGAMQNLLFNALQSGLAWALFDDDEDDEELTEKNKEQKFERTINGAIDSQLKGLGIQGAVIAGVKNALLTIAEQADKRSPKFEEALDDLLSIAPALGSKIRKLKSAARTVSWNRKAIKEEGFSMDNPAYLAGAQTISAVFNIPLDRAVMKMNNMRNVLNPVTKNWQKVALALGWSGWDVGLPYFGLAEDKPVLTETEKQTKKLFDLNKSDQVKMLLDLGLTKKQIRALTKEEQRVQEIIKLQNKKKDAESKK